MKNYIYYLSIFLVFFSILYVWYLQSTIKFIIFIVFYWTVFYGLRLIYKKIRKIAISSWDYQNFLINFIKKISLSIVILAIMLWFFGYYQIYISPAKMIEYTISNWKKTVVFQEMSHIWAESFYKEVKNNLIEYKNKRFVYFYEWVKPWKIENHKKLNKAMWLNFDNDLYKNFAKLYWVTHQNNKIYMGLVNNLDFNVDVSIDWVISEYEKLDIKTWDGTKKEKEVINLNSEIMDSLSKLNERQLKIMIFVNKSILNFLIKSDWLQNTIKDSFANKHLFKIIIDWRDKILAKQIIESSYDKIYVTYWKLHFSWVLKLLQKNDKNWKIVKQKELISIR